jgi:hypothetical protein
MGGISRAATVDLPQTPESYSAPALYNLGNAYARSHNPALAVLNYERALVLAPMDPDIRANVREVRASAGLPAPPGGWLSEHDRFADPNAMYWLGLFGLTLAGASFLVRRFYAYHRRACTVAAAVGVLLTTLSVCDALATASILNESVVMQTAPAGASPIYGAPPLFTAPAAEVVSVRGEHQGFMLIRDSRGREGWVARDDLTPVIPSRATSPLPGAPT